MNLVALRPIKFCNAIKKKEEGSLGTPGLKKDAKAS